MAGQSLRDLIALVQNPTHYLGTEVNVPQKDAEKVRLRFGLAFPDLYEVGMSHVGIQILYHILNMREEIAAERVFAPGVDLEARLRAEGMPLVTLESGRPLSSLDILGFSLLYELTFTNILNMLDLSGIPFYARERNASHPFIIAGGPCAFNPEPLADFFDVMVIGDGEEVIVDLADAWLRWKDGGGRRRELLDLWSQLQGVYVPSFFDVGRDNQGFQNVAPKAGRPSTIAKSLVPDLNEVSYPDRPLVPFGNPIHNRLSLEICRGCTRGCRFCQAGIIYRPVRERSPHRVISLASQALENTGYEDLSLLSLSTGDYGAIQVLMDALMNRCEPERVAISLPSLRVGSLTESLMNQIKRVRKTGFTIAPEAGSQRLREVINKNISERDLEETVHKAFELGWRLIKLYFMIGLPTETEEDLEEIIALVRRLKKIRPSGGGKNSLTVSVSTFIPKAHTPFQWCSQVSLDESRTKLRMLRDRLRERGLRFKWQNPEMSLLEGLWARGDRSLSPLLVAAYERGCRFDGWSDHFDYGLWQAAIEASGVDVAFYTTRARDLSEPLPWDHIDPGVSKDFLQGEWEKALSRTRTDDCRSGECHLCGVCDFEAVKPVTFEADSAVPVNRRPSSVKDGPFKKIRISYAKGGPARYFGHLEMVKIFMRAFRRARIPLRFSQGFHPAPKVSFEAALPVGVESVEEHFTVQVPLHVSRETLLERVNAELPEGLTLTACRALDRRPSRQGDRLFRYTVDLEEGTFSDGKLKDFLEKKAWPVTKTNRKGKTRTIDLKDLVVKLDVVSPKTVKVILKETSAGSVRLTDALAAIFELSEESLKLATIVKSPAD